MTTRTQGLVLAVLAVVLIRISLTGEYLRFVTPWMRWPLVVTGVVLLVVAFRPVLGRTPATLQDRAPRSAWLLLLPVLVVFSVAPPPLGAFLADRRAEQPASLPEPEVVALPESDAPLPLTVGEFLWGAAEPGDPMGIAGQPVTMTGFVSGDSDDGWYLTRLEIFCCAADAVVMRVRISGREAPPRDQWVQVTGTWVEGTGRDPDSPATLEAEQVIEVDAPRKVYS